MKIVAHVTGQGGHIAVIFEGYEANCTVGIWHEDIAIELSVEKVFNDILWDFLLILRISQIISSSLD